MFRLWSSWENIQNVFPGDRQYSTKKIAKQTNKQKYN